MRQFGTATLTIAALLVLAAPFAKAADTAVDPLAEAAAKGAHLFTNETFGGRGNTCESCHADGGKAAGLLPNGRQLPSLANAAAIFPRYSSSLRQVVTLEGQIRQCIHGGLGGTPPEYGSPELVDLVAYLGTIAKGQPVNIGGAPK